MTGRAQTAQHSSLPMSIVLFGITRNPVFETHNNDSADQSAGGTPLPNLSHIGQSFRNMTQPWTRRRVEDSDELRHTGNPRSVAGARRLAA